MTKSTLGRLCLADGDLSLAQPGNDEARPSAANPCKKALRVSFDINHSPGIVECLLFVIRAEQIGTKNQFKS
jgi:hypothetical protein